MTINQLPTLAQAELEARRRAQESEPASEEPTATAAIKPAEALQADEQREQVREQEIRREEVRRQEERQDEIEQTQAQDAERRAERNDEIEQRRTAREENRQQILRELDERQDERRQAEARSDERLEQLREEREALRERRLALQEQDQLQAQEQLANRRDAARLQAEREATDELRNEQALQQPVTDNYDQVAGDPSRRTALADDEEELATRLNFDQTTDLNAPDENLEGAAPVTTATEATEVQSTAIETLEDVATVDPYGNEDLADTIQLLGAEADVLREMIEITEVDDASLQSELDDIEQRLEDETEREANRLQADQGSTDRLGNFIDSVS